MPTTVKKPSHPKKLKTIGVALRKEMKDIGEEVKKELQEIVSPFNSSINIVAIYRQDSDGYIVEVMGNPNDVATINAANNSVSSHDLFKFLDGGTSVRYVGMPDDFRNETTPNSKDTTSQEYDRDEIYFRRNPITPGIEARNWLKLIKEETGPKLKENLDKAIRGYLR